MTSVCAYRVGGAFPNACVTLRCCLPCRYTLHAHTHSRLFTTFRCRCYMTAPHTPLCPRVHTVNLPHCHVCLDVYRSERNRGSLDGTSSRTCHTVWLQDAPRVRPVLHCLGSTPTSCPPLHVAALPPPPPFTHGIFSLTLPRATGSPHALTPTFPPSCVVRTALRTRTRLDRSRALPSSHHLRLYASG